MRRSERRSPGVTFRETSQTPSPNAEGISMGTIGMILSVIGSVISLVGGIWLVVLAFQKSVLWGLGCLLIPCIALYFAFTNWELAKKPFLIMIGGIVLSGIGQGLAASGAHG
jgi:hypothetical protein